MAALSAAKNHGLSHRVLLTFASFAMAIRICRHGTNDGGNFRKLRDRKAAHPCVLKNQVLAFRQIDAECLVRRDERLEPLYFSGKPGKHAVRLGGNLPKLRAVEPSDARDLAFDHVAFHGWVLI